MQRRVAIARALVHEPELLVLDEPTLGVDSDNRHRIWQYIRAVRRSGVTVLLSSNYLDEVEALCDHVVVLGSGRVVGQLSPDELFRRAGWWLEAECADDGFPDLVFICRRQAALEVIVEQPAVRLRFADAASADRSMTDLVASGVVSSVRQRRPDLVEIFAASAMAGDLGASCRASWRSSSVHLRRSWVFLALSSRAGPEFSCPGLAFRSYREQSSYRSDRLRPDGNFAAVRGRPESRP